MTFTLPFLEKGMAAHSNVLVWRIPWIEDPGRLQSMGLQRVEHNRSYLAHTLVMPKASKNMQQIPYLQFHTAA